MQFPHDTNQHKLKNRRISTIRFQYLKYTQGIACEITEMQSGLAPYRDQAPLVWMAPEGAEGQAATPGTPVGSQATTLQNKNRRPRRICGFIVREGGVEPPLHHWNTDLNRARLPIPPLARTQKE